MIAAAVHVPLGFHEVPFVSASVSVAVVGAAAPAAPDRGNEMGKV